MTDIEVTGTREGLASWKAENEGMIAVADDVSRNAQNEGLHGSIRTYCKIEAEVARLAADAKELNTQLAEAEQRVIDGLVDAEVDKITLDGRTYGVDIKARISPATGKTDDVVEWIEHNGGADLVKPAMNAARRDAFLRELCLDEDGNPVVPDELAELVSVFMQTKLTKRKA